VSRRWLVVPSLRRERRQALETGSPGHLVPLRGRVGLGTSCPAATSLIISSRCTHNKQRTTSRLADRNVKADPCTSLLDSVRYSSPWPIGSACFQAIADADSGRGSDMVQDPFEKAFQIASHCTTNSLFPMVSRSPDWTGALMAA
jgi:hypothetical protein